jgi:hypothetical protein
VYYTVSNTDGILTIVLRIHNNTVYCPVATLNIREPQLDGLSTWMKTCLRGTEDEKRAILRSTTFKLLIMRAKEVMIHKGADPSGVGILGFSRS